MSVKPQSPFACIHGGGAFTDDLGDEGILSTTTNTPSNAVCVWQEILLADGYLGTADVDGSFGPRTEAATKSRQSSRGLAADGSVGKNTFGAADASLTFDGGSTASGQYLYMRYNDAIEFTRNTTAVRPARGSRRGPERHRDSGQCPHRDRSESDPP